MQLPLELMLMMVLLLIVLLLMLFSLMQLPLVHMCNDSVIIDGFAIGVVFIDAASIPGNNILLFLVNCKVLKLLKSDDTVIVRKTPSWQFLHIFRVHKYTVRKTPVCKNPVLKYPSSQKP